MLKALGILLFAVSLEAGFLYTVVAPRPAAPEARGAALVADASAASGFDGAARRW